MKYQFKKIEEMPGTGLSCGRICEAKESITKVTASKCQGSKKGCIVDRRLL